MERKVNESKLRIAESRLQESIPSNVDSSFSAIQDNNLK